MSDARHAGDRPRPTAVYGAACALLAVLPVTLAAACAGGPPASPAGEEPNARQVAHEVQQKALQPAQDAIRSALSPEKPVQVLALSGGGPWGAFGAGFLQGWTDHGRPESFQVVTGTSTGSLIATYAFLGRGFDKAVGDAYLGIRGDDDVMEKRFLLTALFSDALASTKPLRRLLDRNITDEMLRLVADEGRKGRRLFVGAVDLDTGVFHPFDLTAIAARGPSARKDYVDALMASTAIPAAFPPVAIGGGVFVDGGVRRNIFLQLLVDELGRLRRTQLRAGLAIPPQPTVYCLINGSLDVGARVVERRTIDIARRAVDILLDESTDGNLLRIFLAAQRAQLAFRLTRVPPGACQVPASKDQFDPALMKCLYDLGQKLGQDPAAWTQEPPLDDYSS